MASLKLCNNLVMNFLTYILEHYYSYTNSMMIDVDRRFMFSSESICSSILFILRYTKAQNRRNDGLTCNEFIKIAHASTVEIVSKKNKDSKIYIHVQERHVTKLLQISLFFESFFPIQVSSECTVRSHKLTLMP